MLGGFVTSGDTCLRYNGASVRVSLCRISNGAGCVGDSTGKPSGPITGRDCISTQARSELLDAAEVTTFGDCAQIGRVRGGNDGGGAARSGDVGAFNVNDVGNSSERPWSSPTWLRVEGTGALELNESAARHWFTMMNAAA